MSAAYVLILCFGPKFMGMCASGQELVLESQQQCQEAKVQYSPAALGNGGYAICVPGTTKRLHNGQETPIGTRTTP